ncbi:MAG: NAD-dependent deacylase [Deltaproteobacteria bacterium]|nr:NAD-dependent deacylase [Deltaproteobacteria bacterium]
MGVDKDLIKKTAQAIRHAKKVVALTGAGISVESGIPDFRGPAGIWEKFDPMEYATIEAFSANPKKVWAMLKEMGSLLEKSKPNPAHISLAKLEEMGYLHSVVTQNIDNLHQAAGSKRVIEFHGSGQRLICMICSRMYERQEVKLDTLPPRCSCNGVLKPNIVFFGEPIPWGAHLEAREEAGNCGLMLVIGTSAVVSPACDLPAIAKRAGATIVEINLEETQLTRYISAWILKGSASLILHALLMEVVAIEKS